MVLAAVPAEAGLTVFENTSGDGLWGTATNWSLGWVPGATDHAVVNNGSVATVAANAPFVDIVTVGNNAVSNTILFIQADLAANWFRVSWASDAIGAVHQSNGVVTVSNTFQVAATAAGSDLGTYAIHGGSLLFSNVTLEVGTQGEGLFTVDGSSPGSISGGAMTLGKQATLAFDLGMLGVTPVRLSGNLTVDATSKLIVDGTDYEALDGYFPLVLTPNQVGRFEPTNATFTGLAAREPALVVQSDGLWLRLLAPPAMSDRLLSLVPESTVAPDYANTQFSASRALDPSGSPWSLTLNEAHVMDTRLSQDVLDGGLGETNRSWDLRVARGGHLYSLRTPALGETVPPSYRSDGDSSPWNDEVWQGVSVTPLNNPPDSPYFMHQSGVYWKQDPSMDEPFYSPQVGAELDLRNRSVTTVNWTPQAHVKIYTDAATSNDWKSYQLVYTRYRDLGQGVIEVTLGNYNYGPDLITWMNAPWGGVRRTRTEYAFISETNGTSWIGPMTNGFGNLVTNYNETGGWVGFSASSNGVTPSLGLVFGQDRSPLPTNSVGASWYRWGYTSGPFSTNETTWRNYFVSSNIRRYNLAQGHGIWSRTYFVLGDDLSDLSSRIAAGNLVDVELREFDYKESMTPQIGYSFTGTGTSFRVTQDNSSPNLFLYAHPVNGSFPIFEIIESNSWRYLTWNPYAVGFIKPYDGSMAGIRLLGFALRGTDVNSQGTSYAYDPLANVMASASSNYIADGEDLSVRISCIQSWRLEHFGLKDNAGLAANTADPDGDGMENLLEYALGGDPTNGNDAGIVPTLKPRPDGSFTNWEYVYRRLLDPDAHCLDYIVLTTSNLQTAAWTTNGYAETGTAVIDADVESVTNLLDFGEFNFVRLQVIMDE